MRNTKQINYAKRLCETGKPEDLESAAMVYGGLGMQVESETCRKLALELRLAKIAADYRAQIAALKSNRV